MGARIAHHAEYWESDTYDELHPSASQGNRRGGTNRWLWLFQNAMENNSSSVRQLYTNAYAVYQHRTLELVVRRNDLYERGIELSAQHIPVYNTGQIGQGGEPGAGASGTAVFQTGLDYDVCGDLHASDYTAISDPSEIR